MNLDSVIEGLLKTEKGKLKYYSEWSPKDLTKDISTPRIRKSNDGVVFKLTSMRAALEAIEDDAITYERNYEEEIFRESWRESKQKDEDVGDNFQEFVDAPIRRYEAELQEQKRREDFERICRQEAFYAELERKTNERPTFRQSEERARKEREDEMVRKFLRESEESALRIEREMQEQQEHLLKTRMQEMKERKLKLQYLEMQKQKENFQTFTDITRNIQTLYKKSLDKIKTINEEHTPLVQNSNIPVLVTDLNYIFNQTNSVFNATKTIEKIRDEELKLVDTDFQTIQVIYKNILAECSIIDSRIEEDRIQAEKMKQELLIKQQKEAEKAKKLAASQASTSKIPPTKSTNTSALSETYRILQTKMNEFENQGRSLTRSNDRQSKQLAMNLSRAISVPISSITDRSGSDLKSRLRILVDVIKGNTVMAGAKSVSTRGNQQASSFAINLMAKKIVSQANEQISANFTSAFPIAFMVIGIWAESKDFGDLFLAHLHSRCIFSIPMYLLKKENQSEEEHQKSLGYVVSEDGSIEQQDKYLRRMSGLVRLYAAVIQSPPPPGVAVHPHGLAHGWTWMAEMLNMEPIPDVSATVLYDFLEVTGHALFKAYGRQFEKLLYVLCHDYYPKLEEVTGSGHKVPLIRLKNFLEKCIKEKSVPLPKGRLDKGFWNTYHSGEVVGE